MNVNRDQVMDFIARNHRAVLATLRRDGRPQLSNVGQALMNGRIEISSTETTAKVKNLRRDPRATVLILSDTSWYQYVVVYGTATIIPLPEARVRLREIYEAIAGKPHPDWEEFDQAMVNERRVVVSISIDQMVS
jgi:PPOX class probable F420-dependent enzyme